MTDRMVRLNNFNEGGLTIKRVLLNDFMLIEAIGPKRIIARDNAGKAKHAKYLSVAKVLDTINQGEAWANEAVKRASSYDYYIEGGQDLTKWFAIQLIRRRYGKTQEAIPFWLWNLANPSVENWLDEPKVEVEVESE